MASGGLFVKQRAADFFNHVSRELIAEIIETPVNFYKIAPYETNVNIYGESDSKKYYQPVTVPGLINQSPEEISTDEFGPDTTQVLIVSFSKEMLRIQHNLVPEIGDVMEWNGAYFQIDNIDEHEFPGGHTDYDYSYICYSHMTRQNIVLIENTRVGQ